MSANTKETAQAEALEKAAQFLWTPLPDGGEVMVCMVTFRKAGDQLMVSVPTLGEIETASVQLAGRNYSLEPNI